MCLAKTRYANKSPSVFAIWLSSATTPAKLLCHTCVTLQEGQIYSSYHYASGINQLPSKDESPLQTSLQCWPWTHCKSRHIPSRLQFACSFAQKPQLLMTPGVWLLKCILQCHKGCCFKPTERLHTVTLCAPVKVARGTNCSPGLHFLFFSCAEPQQR